ncbi:MATE family efflux transporter [Trichlorobacter sp.]|uniref:MATE family efflux transporter n=1 Tax=Trichlorobacter sp. TaxID=2911007 RepID=UPI002A3670CE|nr:MATE family efflux transporter [Trichlorobacter sp.]MDY0384736.1 MATE family efflux transporter [Trichlorobacter sp.]
MRYLIIYLGVDGYGAFAILLSLAGWVALSDCGFSTAFQNTFSENRAKSVSTEILVSQIRFVQYGLTLLWIPIVCALSFPLCAYLFPEMYSASKAIVSTVITGMVIWMTSAVAGISYKLLYAMHKGYLANVYPAIGSILSLLAVITLTGLNRFDNKLLGAVIAYSVPPLLVSLAANMHINTDLRWTVKGLDWPQMHIVMRRAWSFLGFALLVACVTGFDYLIMARILEQHNIAAYNVVSRVFIFIYFLYYSILTAMWPVFTELMTREQYQAVKIRIYKSILLGVVIISFSTAMFLCFRSFISGVLSDNKIVISTQTIICFGSYYLLRVWGDAFAVVLASVNNVKIFWMYMPFQALISLGLQYYLGSRYGLDGIIVGIGISFLLTAVWINPAVLYRQFKQKIRIDVLQSKIPTG